MVIEIVKELQATRARVAELEASLASERQQRLATLPKEFGYDDLNAFISAVQTASGSSGARRGRRAKAAAAPAAGAKKRGRRARITPELKEQVKEAVNAGKTGAAIAKEFGISVPSVQNIKKEFGLVKSRS